MNVQVEISPGELLDKLTILEIKNERIDDPDKLANVRHELMVLRCARDSSIAIGVAVESLTAELKQINEALWAIEDDIRLCERDGDFSDRFVQLARAVYQTNDERARVKRAINQALGSALIEEKSYQPY